MNPSDFSNAVHYGAIIMLSNAERNQYGIPNYFNPAYVMPLLVASFTQAGQYLIHTSTFHPSLIHFSRDVHYSGCSALFPL